MNSKPLQQLLETEMDRKEFLLYVGACVLAITGISGILKTLAPPSKQSSSGTNKKAGYGSSPYGG